MAGFMGVHISKSCKQNVGFLDSLTVGACWGADFGERSCPRGHELRCENPPLIAAPTQL